MVYLNVGRGSGLKNGDLLQVIRDSKIVTDPVTGEVLERETVAIAQLKVVQVRDKVTTARLVDEQQLVELVRGDVVQLLPKP
jgi:DNA-directed RNA polymerase subunit H (RpoH/RPB5)